MFEHDQKIVEVLLDNNPQFKYLYDRHHDLKAKVRDAEDGAVPVDENALGALKKEKLLAKDRMAALIEDYRKQHATH